LRGGFSINQGIHLLRDLSAE